MLVLQQHDLRLVGVRLHVPVEHRGQRARLGQAGASGERACGRCIRPRREQRGAGRRPRAGRRGGAPGHCLQQLTDGFGPLQRVLRQFDAELPLGAQHQLHARQAVEAEVAVELAVQRHRRQAGRARIQIAQRSIDQRKQPFGVGRQSVTVGMGCEHDAAESGDR